MEENEEYYKMSPKTKVQGTLTAQHNVSLKIIHITTGEERFPTDEDYYVVVIKPPKTNNWVAIFSDTALEVVITWLSVRGFTTPNQTEILFL